MHLILLSWGTEFCAFGIPVYLVGWFALSPKASGPLPLTRASAARLRFALVGSVMLLPLSVLTVAAGLVIGNTLEPVRSRIGVWIDIAGVALAILFVICLYVRPLLGPGAHVHNMRPGETDRRIELKRVHHAFANAVRDRSQAHLASTPGSP